MGVDIEPVRAFVVCLRAPAVPVALDLGADDGDGLGRQPAAALRRLVSPGVHAGGGALAVRTALAGTFDAVHGERERSDLLGGGRFLFAVEGDGGAQGERPERLEREPPGSTLGPLALRLEPEIDDSLSSLQRRSLSRALLT